MCSYWTRVKLLFLRPVHNKSFLCSHSYPIRRLQNANKGSPCFRNAQTSVSTSLGTGRLTKTPKFPRYRRSSLILSVVLTDTHDGAILPNAHKPPQLALSHPTTEEIACGTLLLYFLTYITRAPTEANGYHLQNCIPSQGPGSKNRPCWTCLQLILPSDLSIKHKPCGRAYHMDCYLDWIDASIYNFDTPMCPLCHKALLTYEQTLQLFPWRFSRRQKRLFWRLYLNALVCRHWLALAAVAGSSYCWRFSK